jgi:hypothetical protein
MPVRVQQRRTKGWRKPPGAVSVVRGTRWGPGVTTAKMIEAMMEGYEQALEGEVVDQDEKPEVRSNRHEAGCGTDLEESRQGTPR